MKNIHKIFIIFLIVLSTSLSAKDSHATIIHSWHQKDNTHYHHTSHADFSHDRSQNNISTSPSHKHHFKQCSAQDFKQYFTSHGYTENQILNQSCLYMFDEFVKYAQTYSGYKCTIQQLHAELKNLYWWQKAWYKVNGTYCYGLQKRIHYLYNQLNSFKHEQPIRNEPVLRDYSLEAFQTQLSEYKELQSAYRAHAPLLSHAIDTRLDAYNNLSGADNFLHYANKSYNLNNNIKQLLHKYNCDTAHFTQCFGNQLQHIIHQESLDLLNHIDHLSPTSVLYDHQEALIDFTVAMVDYNHEGLTDKATTIADFCWTLLDYGQAVAEGAALGIHSAVTDILNNPIEATVSMVASKPLLAYQLSKVLYNVADIGFTAITNIDQAKDKWDKYAAPLNGVIDKIYKKEISLRDAVKGGTAIVVGLTAQSKLLGGLGKFCNTIKQKSINFAQNSSLLNPQQYLATPEGLLLKATSHADKLKQSGQTTASSLKNNVEKITVWNNIKPTDRMYPGTKIPKSFEISAGSQKFWVCPNATKHMLDYVTKHLDITYTTPVNSQTLLASFQSAVKQAASNGIQYNTMINIGCWQFRFDTPRKTGLLPTIYHANFKPKGW